jgi:hypothetical protein
MLRLATQKRRFKSKVQELTDDDVIFEVAPREASRAPDAAIESRSGIVAFPSYAHDAPTRTFIGRIDTWKLPPPPRIPVLASFIDRPPSHSESSVPPVALSTATIPAATERAKAARKLASAAATQKIRAALGEITGNTLLIVQGRPSVAWAAGLLAIGICFGAFLARPGRSELGSETGHEAARELAPAHAVQANAAPEILVAAATTRAPTVSEVPAPIVILAAAPAPVPVPVAPPKIASAKRPLAKPGRATSAGNPR